MPGKLFVRPGKRKRGLIVTLRQGEGVPRHGRRGISQKTKKKRYSWPRTLGGRGKDGRFSRKKGRGESGPCMNHDLNYRGKKKKGFVFSSCKKKRGRKKRCCLRLSGYGAWFSNNLLSEIAL